MTPTFLSSVFACLRFPGLLLLAACVQQPQQADPQAAAPAATPTTVAAAPAAPRATGLADEICFGRYALRLPDGARVIGREQAMRRIGMRAREVPAGTDLAHIQTQAPWLTRADLATRIGPTVTPVSADTVLLTWRATDRNAAIVDTEAVRLTGGRLLAAHAQGEGTEQVAAQRADALDLLAAASPRPEGTSPARGFCIDRFVIAREFRTDEFAGIAVETGRERRLYATMRSNGDQVGRRVSQGGPGTAPAGVTILRAGARSAGGHAGDELVLSRSQEGKREMLLLWRFVGAPNSGAQPALELRLEAGDVTAPDTVLAEWDGLVNSLRRRD